MPRSRAVPSLLISVEWTWITSCYSFLRLRDFSGIRECLATSWHALQNAKPFVSNAWLLPSFFFIEVILHMSHSRCIITIPCVQGLYWSESRAVSRLLCILWERRWHSPNLMCLCDLTVYGSQEFRTRWFSLQRLGRLPLEEPGWAETSSEGLTGRTHS